MFIPLYVKNLMRILKFSILSFLVLAIGCKPKNIKQTTVTDQQKQIPVDKRVPVTYSLIFGKDSVKAFAKTLDSVQLGMLGAVNRADKKAIINLDTIIVPTDLGLKPQQYFPFPFELAFVKDVNKIIFFSYPAQAFAAYERGRLVYTGATSMGRRADTTPVGLFYTNWKAEQTTSTFNDEWDLKWNFNIENKLGVGFHEYAMPGYPASHSCLRLTEADAKYLYNWAQQWELEGTDNILAYGTPVVVFGSYPFGSPRPWLALVQNAGALDITEQNLQAVAGKYLPDIMQKQQQRLAMGK